MARALPRAEVIECCSVIALDFSLTSQLRQVGLSFTASDVMKKSAVKDDPRRIAFELVARNITRPASGRGNLAVLAS